MMNEEEPGRDKNFESFKREYRDDEANDAPFNLAVVGLTGAGKSTLVNAVLNEEAPTGIGKPVTRGVRYYLNDAETLGLYDFEGIETGQELSEVVDQFKTEFRSRLRGDTTQMIHGVWYCVRATDLRFEDGQAKIVTELSSLDVPVFLVLTRVAKHPERGVHPQALELAESIRLRGLPIVTGRPVLVNAVEDEYAGNPVHGLERLVELTGENADEGVKAAWAAAQQVDLSEKSKAARQVVGASAAAAGFAGLAPTPGADSLAIIPIQAAMMRRVARIYGIPIEPAQLAAAMSTMAVTFAGRAAYSALLKLVPGFGSLAGGAIATTFTAALGVTWTQLCARIFRGELDIMILSDYEALGEAILRGIREYFTEREGREGRNVESADTPPGSAHTPPD